MEENTSNSTSSEQTTTTATNENNTSIPDEPIQITVKDLEGNEVVMKMKKTTPMSKLMQGYAKNRSQDLNSLRFLFDGSRVLAEQTPADLRLENDDIIEVVLQQVNITF